MENKIDRRIAMTGIITLIMLGGIGFFVYTVVNDCAKDRELRRKNLEALKDFDKNVRGK